MGSVEFVPTIPDPPLIVVAKNYHTVFISDIPIMRVRIRDKEVTGLNRGNSLLKCKLRLCTIDPCDLALFRTPRITGALVHRAGLATQEPRLPPSLLNYTVIIVAYLFQGTEEGTLFDLERLNGHSVADRTNTSYIMFSKLREISLKVSVFGIT
ncbi:hypothetical protein HAX54_012108 [Datura stramonium]|uniref:Uncharacterized protein n=1 Tax=Datura stramonium TaxID=4076 RepID=A0ABS8RJ22_DATST|nr:hypothetical protein [Datura stramonium]